MKHKIIWILLCLIVGRESHCFSQSLPIKPARTISLTTDEGTNMNLNISPDGRTLVFDLLGNLYTLPVSGGNATQLTRGMAVNTRPAWSPDGKMIAYLSDQSGAMHINVRNLTGEYHVVLDSNGEQLHPFEGFCWTPDGKYIATNEKLYGLAGGVIPINDTLADFKGFSAKGHLIFYKQDGRNLYRYNSETFATTLIDSALNNESYTFNYGVLSRNAKYWAFTKDSSSNLALILRDLSKKKEKKLVPSLLGKSFLYSIPPPHYVFSPDAKYLYVSYGGKIHRIETETVVDRIIPFKAKIKFDFGALDYNKFPVSLRPFQIKYMRNASASPDGKKIVFAALGKIYCMNLPGGRPRLLVKQDLLQAQPAWSPDGKWIAYVSWCDSVGGFLWRVPAAGGRPEQLTSNAREYEKPTWSPDGKSIAVIGAAPILLNSVYGYASGSLQRINIQSGETQTLADTVSFCSQPVFSSNGERISYTPDLRGKEVDSQVPLLVSRDLNGMHPKVLATGFAPGTITSYIYEALPSPDNRYIVYSLGEDLYLVPETGLQHPTILYDSQHTYAATRFSKGVDPVWDKGGKILSWTYGNHFYSVNPDKVMQAAAQRKAEGLRDSAAVTVAVRPEKDIHLHITVPTQYGRGTIALRNVRLITMNGNKVINHGTIVIKNGRFMSVGPSEITRIPTGAKTLDLSGKTVIPGLIDLHLHLNISSDIYPQQAWQFLANLAYGVTTARDPSTNIDSYGYEELLRSGGMIGPRLFSSGQAVMPNYRSIIRADNFDDTKLIVGKRQMLGGTFIKQYEMPTRLQREWLLLASKDAGLNMTNEGEFALVCYLAQIKDGSTGVEHSPYWGDAYKDVITIAAKSGSVLTPTLQVIEGYQLQMDNNNSLHWHNPNQKMLRFLPDEALEKLTGALQLKNFDSTLLYPARIFARIRHAGGLIGLGSHGNNEGTGPHNELWALQSGGLTNLEALQSATIVGAQALGMQKDVGSIEPGKIADLVILNSNPLDDIHNSRDIKYVMKNGILYDGETLEELWPEHKKCPDWKFHGKITTITETNKNNTDE